MSAPVSLQAHEFDLLQALPDKTTTIATVTSEEQAIAFFFSEFAPILGLKQKKRPDPTSQPTSEFTEMAKNFTATLGVWRVASRIQSAAQDSYPHQAQDAMTRESDHLTWITQTLHSPLLTRTVSLSSTVFALFQQEGNPELDSVEYREFSEYFDGTYPELVGTKNSWISLAEREGTAGLFNRFNEFWNQNNSPDRESLASPDPYALRYIQVRLGPVLRAYLLASAIRLQVQAEQQALSQWQKFQEWHHTERTRQSLVRLCGTWKWIIHNHQNHQDYKSVMVFPPPDQMHVMKPPPAQVVIQGNTVFMRWEFSGGYQEDSLLLSARDRQLEGTFLNSMGPHGNISARKIQPCPSRQTRH